MRVKISCLLIMFFVLYAKAQTNEENNAALVKNEMVLIPAGEYIIGMDSDKNRDFSPAHNVWVDSFYMDKYEVTNAEYYRFCVETGHKMSEYWGQDRYKCSLKYPNHPVIGVNYYDAVKYAKWAGKRLPTEAEWEVAARGGETGLMYPNSNVIDSSMANYRQFNSCIVKAGTYEPNGYGLFDMCGNVWEWTNDYYGYSYYNESEYKNPQGPDVGKFIVIRGGSWHSGAMCVKVNYRNALPAGWVDFAVGIRCVKNVD